VAGVCPAGCPCCLVEHWLFIQLPRDGAASTLPRLAGLRNGFLIRLAGWARCWVLRKQALVAWASDCGQGRGFPGWGACGLVPSVA
jgi:hypothetical protein